MSEQYSEREKQLRAQLAQSTDAMQARERELQAIDDELAALGHEQRQYDALSQACRALEALTELDAAQLFWGANDGAANGAHNIAHARGKIDAFSARVAEVETRRQAVLSTIDDQDNQLENLHYALKDVIAYEERRKEEWLVEREANSYPVRKQVMPWASGLEEDRRFQRSLLGSILASCALAVLVGTVALPIVERSKVSKLPERVARVVREERIAPPPPAPIVEPIAPLEAVVEPKPQPVPQPAHKPLPEPVEEPLVAEVRQPAVQEQVQAKGILAFRDSFASRAGQRPSAQLGARAQLSSAGENAVTREQRAMVSSSAQGSSGGINLADISRNVGGGGQAIEGVQVSRVASSIGGGAGPDRPLSGGASAGRTDEEIQIVFDRYKAALYRLYNRELRKNPALRGQLVLRLTIEPDGSVSVCQLQSSDMDAPALARQIVDRVLGFDFGAKMDIVPMTIIYPIDFLPAA